MQAITAGLEAILKDKFQAGASGFRGRIEVDRPVVTPIARVQGTGVCASWGVDLTLTLGADPTPGNLLVLTGWTTAEHTINMPAGFTLAGSLDADDNNSGGFIYYRIVQSGDSDTWVSAAGGAGTASRCLYLAEYEGAGLPLDPTYNQAAATHTGTNPLTVTPTDTADGLVVGLFFQYDGGHGTDVWWVAGADTTELFAHNTGSADVGPIGLVGETDTDTLRGLANWGDYPRYGIALVLPQGTTTALVTPIPGLDADGSSLQPKRISIDKSLRMTADQATVEFANEDLPLGWGPDSVFVTNSRCRIYQWYGDDTDNAVLTFTGLIDAVTDNRDVATTSITCRDMMALLLDQTFGATAPQGADEDGAVRTAANGVYLSMQVGAIIEDILDRAGWPTADRDIGDPSYLLDEYIIPDGTSWAEAIIGESVLTGLTGYDAWADELGVFHFAPSLLEDSLTDPGTPAYTFESGVDIVSLQDMTDQYDLRTRVKVRGPLTTTTLTDTWREIWRTSKFAHPVGLWYDSTDSANIRVLDRGTKRLYKLRQSDRVVLSSTYLGGVIPYPLGVSGDPSDATIYWVLNGPWLWGSGANSSIKKVRKADNVVLATYTLDTDHWSAVKVSGAYIYATNLSDERVYRRNKATGAAVDDFRHTYQTVAQSNPSGLMIDGTTISVFWSNGGTTARFLQCAEAAPGTVTKVVKTAGTSLHGGEMDTTTHTECWGDDDGAGLVAKFTLVEAVDQTDEVYAEVVDTDLEDELGALAQMESREHDTHPLDADHAFEIRRDTVDVTIVTSLAQATETAMRRLDKLSQRRRVLDVGVIGNPALQKSDLVSIVDPVTGLNDEWVIDTYRTEMAADSTYLGTLALLPVSVPDDDPTDDGDATE